jgi:AGCS family alanine or glycine:cation symporter
LKYKKAYLYFYLASIVFGAVSSVSLVVDLIDLLYALMVLVNMPAVFYLAPKVKEALQNYRRDAS